MENTGCDLCAAYRRIDELTRERDYFKGLSEDLKKALYELQEQREAKFRERLDELPIG